MIDKIKNLTALIEAERKALDTDDLDVTLTAHMAHCAAYLKEFNLLEPKERFDLLTAIDFNGKVRWNKYAIAMAVYAIGHAYLVTEPEFVLDRVVDHMVIDGEAATIVTTIAGEKMSFDNFPEFGEAHFSNYFPLHDEAAIATKHIAMMCRGLGRIW